MPTLCAGIQRQSRERYVCVWQKGWGGGRGGHAVLLNGVQAGFDFAQEMIQECTEEFKEDV